MPMYPAPIEQAAATADAAPATGRPGTDCSGTGRLQPGSRIPIQRLTDSAGEEIAVPDPSRVIHLQFRRFAGCPICNLHLHTFARRHEEIAAAGIREVVLFHSAREDLLRHAPALPFALVPDPQRRLYAAFGVEAASRALFSPAAWPGILRAICHATAAFVAGRAALPPLAPAGGRLGLPADFLVDRSGRVLACRYGAHADDHWSVDEMLAAARTAAR